jgi:hypothetical protein
MLIINHRVNTLAKLATTPVSFGVEVDVKEKSGKIFTGHDPEDQDVLFDEWAEAFNHKIAAVNIKQEGIESEVIGILERNKVENFFLFDLSFPMLKKLSDQGESRLAVRVSDLEGFEHAAHFDGKVKWIWLDVFNNTEFLQNSAKTLSNFKICAVSPELHTERSRRDMDTIMGGLVLNLGLISAICTKEPQQWSAIT